jgi:hypothetical protein
MQLKSPLIFSGAPLSDVRLQHCLQLKYLHFFGEPSSDFNESQYEQSKTHFTSSGEPSSDFNESQSLQ